MPIFTELALVIVLTTAVSVLMRLLRQPLVVGYIFAGIIIGPYLLDILHSVEYIELFSKIGITTLLFIVGIGLNPTVIKEVGGIALLTGVGQVVFTSVIGFFIAQALGFSTTASLYIAIALTFSSTIIVLKLLSDKGDTHKLYGKIAIGFLLIQDLIATIILLGVSTFAKAEGVGASDAFVSIGVKGVVAVGAVYIIAHLILPHVSKFLAASQELLFLFSIAWGFALAALFGAIGFSIEIGALIAGISLSLSPFSYEIAARMKPLRDFFIILFFIFLGSQMVLSNVLGLVYPAIIFSAFVLIGNPFIMYILMSMLGYKRRTSFMAGLTVAQISEFSLILIALGLSIGHIEQSIMSLVTLVGLITIAGSTYMILYADQLFRWFDPFLRRVEIHLKPMRRIADETTAQGIVIFGYDRVGVDFVQAAEKIGENVLVVDFNPSSIRRLDEKGITYRYGDAEDVEFLNELFLDRTPLIISTIPDFNTNMLLVGYYKHTNRHGISVVICHNTEEARRLYEQGATYVVMPHYLGAAYAADMITKHGLDKDAFNERRRAHLKELRVRDLL